MCVRGQGYVAVIGTSYNIDKAEHLFRDNTKITQKY